MPPPLVAPLMEDNLPSRTEQSLQFFPSATPVCSFMHSLEPFSQKTHVSQLDSAAHAAQHAAASATLPGWFPTPWAWHLSVYVFCNQEEETHVVPPAVIPWRRKAIISCVVSQYTRMVLDTRLTIFYD